MKRHWHIVSIFIGALALLVSCSTEVDLFADGEDVPIVYALLDPDADTNFVKITHSMGVPGDPINANNPELTNYPGKLDVRITEYCNGDSVRQFVLDTITIWDKEEGLFYSPAQKLYYTTERFNKNSHGKWYSYKLTAVLPDRTLTAVADMVGSDSFFIRSSVVDFSGGNHHFDGGGGGKATHEIWFNPAANGGIYDIYMTFIFFERRSWTSDTIRRSFTWHVDTFYQFFLPQHLHNGAFVATYYPFDLYYQLNEFLGDDTLVPGLRRYLDDEPIQVSVTAGDRSLEEYVFFYNMSSSPTGENISSPIDGGFGVFSALVTVERGLRLGGTTLPELLETNWGFKYVGGHL